MIEIHQSRYPQLEQPEEQPPPTSSAPQSFGQRLREIRQQLGLTQADVEQLTRRLSHRWQCPEFALTESRLSRIENDWSLPGAAKIMSLAKIYHLSLRQLVRLWPARRHCRARNGRAKKNADNGQ